MRKFLTAICLVGLSVCAFADRPIVANGITFSRPQGENLRLNLYLPAESGGKPRPAVLLIHGGGWVLGTRYQMRWFGSRLAESGYVAAAIDYRTMPEFAFPYCLYDCKAAVRWMRLHAQQYNVDPKRIAVLGTSAGGHLALLLATTQPKDGLEGTENLGPSSQVNAAVSLYGPVDLRYYRHPASKLKVGGVTSRLMDSFVGKASPNGLDPYDAASPLTYADAHSAPTLLIHGTDDDIVPIAQSEKMCERLRSLAVPVQFIRKEGYGHGFTVFHPKARAGTYAEILPFLGKYLAEKPHPAPQPTPPP